MQIVDDIASIMLQGLCLQTVNESDREGCKEEGRKEGEEEREIH